MVCRSGRTLSAVYTAQAVKRLRGPRNRWWLGAAGYSGIRAMATPVADPELAIRIAPVPSMLA